MILLEPLRWLIRRSSYLVHCEYTSEKRCISKLKGETVTSHNVEISNPDITFWDVKADHLTNHKPGKRLIICLIQIHV